MCWWKGARNLLSRAGSVFLLRMHAWIGEEQLFAKVEICCIREPRKEAVREMGIIARSAPRRKKNHA